MWSLGCILAELFTGYPLFPGENEQEQLACIMEIQGVPSKYLVEKSTRKKLFFGMGVPFPLDINLILTYTDACAFYLIDSYGNPRIVPNSKGKKRRPGSKTLAQALKCSDELFLDFVSRCLEWDPDKRLNPEQGLAHQWIAGGDHSHSKYSSNISKPSSGTSKILS
jgi:dual specificity tyrosine-phosphorylation-regulated kinase 2/3/4